MLCSVNIGAAKTAKCASREGSRFSIQEWRPSVEVAAIPAEAPPALRRTTRTPAGRRCACAAAPESRRGSKPEGLRGESSICPGLACSRPGRGSHSPCEAHSAHRWSVSSQA